MITIMHHVMTITLYHNMNDACMTLHNMKAW